MNSNIYKDHPKFGVIAYVQNVCGAKQIREALYVKLKTRRQINIYEKLAQDGIKMLTKRIV